MYSAPCSKQMQHYSASPPPSPSEMCFKHPVTQCPFQLSTHKHAPSRMAHWPHPQPPTTSTLRPDPLLPQPRASFLDCSLQSQPFFQALSWPSSWETSLVPWRILCPLDTKPLKRVSGALDRGWLSLLLSLHGVARQTRAGAASDLPPSLPAEVPPSPWPLKPACLSQHQPASPSIFWAGAAAATPT